MKFIIGFIAGCIVGGLWVSNSTEEQRRRARTAATDAGRRVKESRVGRAVDDNTSKVASTAGDRIADAIDTTGDTLSDAIGDHPEHATA